MTRKSLRSQLLVWLLGPLAVVAAFDAWVAYRSGIATATLVHERLLLGSARSIAEQVTYAEGRYATPIPPAAIEMLDIGNHDHVYYRVDDADGRLLAGYADLATPPSAIAPEGSLGFDATMRGQPIHIMAFAQPVSGSSTTRPVTIEVGQTLSGRDLLAREIWRHSVREQLLMLLLVGGLLVLGLRGGLKPLVALRDRMQRRKPFSLDAIAVDSVPSELQPLIAAFNDYAGRLTRHAQLHSRFIGDASHQLRTPLAVLNMQITFALRQKDPELIQEVLRAIRTSVQGNMRLVNQLLSFSEVDTETERPRQAEHGVVTVSAVVCSVIEELASLAHQQSIDLGFESDDSTSLAIGREHLVHVIASNLIDNALRYTQQGGTVTARVRSEGQSVFLEIVDDGPGIPERERARVFERFYRLHGSGADGCGLGLSIVREATIGCGAQIELTTTPTTGGLTASVRFARAEIDQSATPATSSPRLNAPCRRTAAAAT